MTICRKFDILKRESKSRPEPGSPPLPHTVPIPGTIPHSFHGLPSLADPGNHVPRQPITTPFPHIGLVAKASLHRLAIYLAVADAARAAAPCTERYTSSFDDRHNNAGAQLPVTTSDSWQINVPACLRELTRESKVSSAPDKKPPTSRRKNLRGSPLHPISANPSA